MAKKKQVEYYGGRIKPLVELVAKIIRSEPDVDNEKLHAMLYHSVEGYAKPEKCFNCKRSMKITEYEADLHDALLLLAMAKQVRINIKNGMNFTEANKVHLPTLPASHATVKRNTKCDYLGFVKQPDNWRGSGYWLLTKWAWKALRGEPVPAKVKYWEGNKIGRSEETVTLQGMFNKHRDLVEAAIAKKKSVKADHRSKFADYDPKDWSQFGGYIQEQVNLNNEKNNNPRGASGSEQLHLVEPTQRIPRKFN